MKSFKWKKYNSKKSLIIIDEVLYLSDFIRVIPHCLFWKEVLIATHIPLVYYKIFSLFWKKILKINLEKFPQKIEFYLREHGYDFTEESIKIYAKKFLCTYTDLEIILESSDNEEKNFDRIFLNFLKYRNIGIYPNH
jgi:predicted AAA+ superfamily ATPase